MQREGDKAGKRPIFADADITELPTIWNGLIATLGRVVGGTCSTKRELVHRLHVLNRALGLFAKETFRQAPTPTAEKEIRERMIAIMREAGPDGLSVEELVDKLYPEATDAEREHMRADMERSAGYEPDPDWSPVFRLAKDSNH
jgi:hypothetical protein